MESNSFVLILDLMEREKPKAPTRCLYMILLIGWAISETR